MATAAGVAALREAFARVGYDDHRVDALVRADGLEVAPGLAVLHLRPQGRDPLGLLVRLFLSGDELEPDVAADALAPAALDKLVAAEVLELTPNGRVRALVRLTPVRGLIVASDRRGSGPLRRDHVVYPGPAAATLASLTVRAPVRSTLDLCCGSGVQALIAARHAERVVGTDLNPRALRLAELSAALSGVTNVEWRQGDLFEPVAEERFECVVANPPFVISPSTDLTFRDAGRRGDELSREVVTGCADRLEEGGFGHVLCSWVRGQGEHFSDAPWRAPLAGRTTTRSWASWRSRPAS